MKSTLYSIDNINRLKIEEIAYEKWDAETGNILNKSFVSSAQKYHRDFVSLIPLGNVYIDRNSFQGIRDRIENGLTRKLEFLVNLKNQLVGISSAYILPFDDSEEFEYKANSNSEIKTNVTQIPDNTMNSMQFDYAIMAALEDDEMEKFLKSIEIEGEIKGSNHLIEYGVLKSNKAKRVVFASQHVTGMVDAGILATELIVRFNPKFLIMVGVLGGRPDKVNIGDIIIGTAMFTVDKGKISEAGFQKELGVVTVETPAITKMKRRRKDIQRFIEDLSTRWQIVYD